MAEKVMIYTTADEIAAGMEKWMEKHLSRPQEPNMNPGERLTRRQAAKFLDISYQTMYNWTREGIVKEHGAGKKKFYLKGELLEVIKN
ncbi:MAG TPA: DNA-binding protein, partial [Mariniphaga anaerophila]|nr:DNA-binding protein [Mariniphaga anaerophila]